MHKLASMSWYDDEKDKPVATKFTASLIYNDKAKFHYRVEVNFAYNSSPNDVESMKNYEFNSLQEALVLYNSLKSAVEATASK